MKFFVTVAVLAVLHMNSNFNRESIINAQFIFREEVELVENSECKLESNLSGICTRASLCPQIKLNVSKTKICAFKNSEAIICCVHSSELACHGYGINEDGKLFKKPDNYYFVGGERAKPREYPYMAAIGWTQDTSVSWKCGGSLISKDFLLTAAHCTNDRGVAPDTVRAGVVNLVSYDSASPQPVDYNITQIIAHPSYKSPVIYHDIALLRIVPAGDIIIGSSICLWPNQEPPTTELVGMGFGTTSFAGPQSNELFVGSLQNVPQAQCNAVYGTHADNRFSNGIIESQLCAKDPTGAKDTCQGDSGGPLQFVDYLTFKIYQVGITSFGEACAGPSPGVYTKVQAYVSWVGMIVWPEFSK